MRRALGGVLLSVQPRSKHRRIEVNPNLIFGEGLEQLFEIGVHQDPSSSFTTSPAPVPMRLDGSRHRPPFASRQCSASSYLRDHGSEQHPNLPAVLESKDSLMQSMLATARKQRLTSKNSVPFRNLNTDV
jgi:hypothetical protein